MAMNEFERLARMILQCQEIKHRISRQQVDNSHWTSLINVYQRLLQICSITETKLIRKAKP